MKLENMREIAAVRTPGPWSVVGPDHNKMVRTNNGNGYGIAAGNADCEFIAMVANTYDKLLYLVEAVDTLINLKEQRRKAKVDGGICAISMFTIENAFSKVVNARTELERE